MSAVLAVGWLWARHRSARLALELAEVDALARECLAEPLQAPVG